MEEEYVEEIMAGYEFVVAGLERAGIFFTMLSRVFETFLFFALLLFSISSFLSFIAPNVQKLLYAYSQSQEPSDDDENGAEEKEIGQKKEAENPKDEKKDLSDKLEILLEEILENKNQVVKELEQEREKHEEERHTWEKEKTSLEDDVRVIKGMSVTFSEKILQWEEERSQLHAELDATRASLQHYQELMHHCDNYY